MAESSNDAINTAAPLKDRTKATDCKREHLAAERKWRKTRLTILCNTNKEARVAFSKQQKILGTPKYWPPLQNNGFTGPYGSTGLCGEFSFFTNDKISFRKVHFATNCSFMEMTCSSTSLLNHMTLQPEAPSLLANEQ